MTDVRVAVSNLNTALRTRGHPQGPDLDVRIASEKGKGYRLDGDIVTFNPVWERVCAAPATTTRIAMAGDHLDAAGTRVELHEVARRSPDRTVVVVGYVENDDGDVVHELERQVFGEPWGTDADGWRTEMTGARLEVVWDDGPVRRTGADWGAQMEYIALSRGPEDEVAWAVDRAGLRVGDATVSGEAGASRAFLVRARTRLGNADFEGARRDAGAGIRWARTDRARAWGWYYLAETCRRAGDDARAADAYEQAARFDTGTYLPAQALAELGSARQVGGKHALAIASYTAALERRPDPETRTRVLCYRGMAKRGVGDHAGTMADYRAALDAATDGQAAALVLRSIVSEALVGGVSPVCPPDVMGRPAMRGAAARLAGEFAGMLEKSEPQQRHRRRGRVAARVGRVARAAAARVARGLTGMHGQSERHRPRADKPGGVAARVALAARAAAHLLRGRAREEEGDPEAAAAEYEKANRSLPTAVAHAARGRCEWEMGRYERAAAEYEAAVGWALRAARRARVLLRRGRSRQAAGDHAGAIEDFELAVRGGLAPEDGADAHLGWGESLEELGQLAEALVQYGESIRSAPDTGAGRLSRSEALAARGALRSVVRDYAGALDDVRAAAGQLPTSLGEEIADALLLGKSRRAQQDVEAAALRAADAGVTGALLVVRGHMRSLTEPEKAVEDYAAAAAVAEGHPGIQAAAHFGAMVPSMLAAGPESMIPKIRALAEIGAAGEALAAARRFGERFREVRA